MIYDSILESSELSRHEYLESLTESYLIEDRMVKYGGDIAPKFGWCVIYVGGPASGKGSATSFKSRLQGDYYNVDDLKEIQKMWRIKNPETGKPYEDEFETPSEFRNMGNSDFVSELHYAMKPVSKKWKKSILNNPENQGEGRDRLPNVIFDIVGDEVEKLSEIIEAMKPIGYKIAIIWMLSTVERAFRNNQMRQRVVDTDSVFIPKHRDVIQAQEELFSTGLIHDVDEFWVIDTAVEVNPKVDPVGYHDEQNVYHIPCTEDGLKAFEHIADRIDYNKKELNRLVQKRAGNFS